jgi:hypothetical protein
MPKVLSPDEERKFTVPISLPQSYVDFVNTEPGKNFSERMRSIIAEAIAERDFVVRFNKGENEPAFKKDDAFMVYQKTDDSREWGGHLPVELTKKEKPKELVALFESAGYQCTIVEFADIGFTSVWAVKKGSRCQKCKAALLKTVSEVLQ